MNIDIGIEATKRHEIAAHTRSGSSDIAEIRASDLDVMWLHGFGFPRYRGGPMYWGDTIGAMEIYNQVAAWHQRYGERWRPSNLLRDVAQKGAKLREIVSNVSL